MTTGSTLMAGAGRWAFTSLVVALLETFAAKLAEPVFLLLVFDGYL